MPQLDIGSYLPQVFWLVISIVVLYVGMCSVVESLSNVLKSRLLKKEVEECLTVEGLCLSKKVCKIVCK